MPSGWGRTTLRWPRSASREPSVSGRGVRLKLAGIDDRDAADRARGKILFVDEAHRAKLAKGQYFVHDVLGLAVREEGGSDLGTVADVLRYPASDVYVIRGDRGEILIPAVKEFIRSVDLETRTMTVRLIEGMVPEVGAMRIDVVTGFPALVAGPLEESILRRAREGGIVDIVVHDLRDYASDRHRTIDDAPYGGGAGMILKVEPVFAAIESLHEGAALRRGHLPQCRRRAVHPAVRQRPVDEGIPHPPLRPLQGDRRADTAERSSRGRSRSETTC